MPNRIPQFGSRPRPQLRREDRGTRQQRGYTDAWLRLSRSWLRRHPLCEDCKQLGIMRPASQVHHTERHHGDAVRVMDERLLRSLCASCHSVRTARGE